MTALRPERESGAAYGESFTDSYGDAGDQGTSYGQQPYEGSDALGEWYGGENYGAEGYGSQGYGGEVPPAAAVQEPYAEPYIPPPDDETVALRIADPPPRGEAIRPSPASPASSATSASSTPTGGRAARRKAAKRRHGRHGGSRPLSEADETGSESSGAPCPAWRPAGRPRRVGPARQPSPAGRSVRYSSPPAC